MKPLRAWIGNLVIYLRLDGLVPSTVMSLPSESLAIVFGLALMHAASAPAEAACRVGLEVRTVFDSTRPYDGQARPVRIVLWYPARVAPAHLLPLSALIGADWISAARPSPGWSDAFTARREFSVRLTEMRSGVGVERALALPSCTGWLTPARPGRFPLVLIGSGLAGRAYYHARLAEELAHAGFVVAFVSTLGPTPGSTPRFDPGSVNPLKEDAIRAFGSLATDERVDSTRVGLVGWSVSGVVQLAIARDIPAVRAAVSLDSGVGYNYGPPLWAGVASAPPRTMPYLHLAAGVHQRDVGLEVGVGAPVGVTHDAFDAVGLAADLDDVSGLWIGGARASRPSAQ